MCRLIWFLAALVLLCASGCGRTSLDASLDSAGGSVSRGGVTSSGGTAPTGGVTGTGGAAPTGGVTSTGGSTSSPDGSASFNELDICSSDADCDYCKWETAPTSSDQCTLLYCCGGMISTKERCAANQAAWNSYCPNQSPRDLVCPCAISCPIACVGGECGKRCPTPP